MAIFHLSVKTVSRGKGQSVIAKAAYNARENLRDEQTGKAKDYARAAGLVFSGIFAPRDAPAWAKDREALWNEVERNENRKDAQLAREITLGLPHELTDEQRRQLVTDFVREQFQRKGMIADLVIHAPSGKGDDRNHHAHVLLTMREIGPDGFGPKVREWNSRPQLETWREEWERIQNRYLERHGHEARVDRRSLEAQGIEREPTTHLGPHAHAMEQSRGIETERGQIARDTMTAAQETAKLKRELAEIDKLIAAVMRERQSQEKSSAHREAAPEITPWLSGTAKLKRELAEVDKLIAAKREAERPAHVERTEPPSFRMTPETLGFQDSARVVTQRVNAEREQPSARSDRAAFTANDVLRVMGPVLSRGAGLGVRAAAVVFGAAANAFESLIAPPRTKTIGEMREINERQVAAGAERDRAFEKFLYDEEHEYFKGKQQEQTQQRQTEQKQYERLRDGGRER